jgi:hypothetical protein
MYPYVQELIKLERQFMYSQHHVQQACSVHCLALCMGTVKDKSHMNEKRKFSGNKKESLKHNYTLCHGHFTAVKC